MNWPGPNGYEACTDPASCPTQWMFGTHGHRPRCTCRRIDRLFRRVTPGCLLHDMSAGGQR